MYTRLLYYFFSSLLALQYTCYVFESYCWSNFCKDPSMLFYRWVIRCEKETVKGPVMFCFLSQFFTFALLFVVSYLWIQCCWMHTQLLLYYLLFLFYPYHNYVCYVYEKVIPCSGEPLITWLTLNCGKWINNFNVINVFSVFLAIFVISVHDKSVSSNG